MHAEGALSMDHPSCSPWWWSVLFTCYCLFYQFSSYYNFIPKSFKNYLCFQLFFPKSFNIFPLLLSALPVATPPLFPLPLFLPGGNCRSNGERKIGKTCEERNGEKLIEKLLKRLCRFVFFQKIQTLLFINKQQVQGATPIIFNLPIFFFLSLSRGSQQLQQ